MHWSVRTSLEHARGRKGKEGRKEEEVTEEKALKEMKPKVAEPKREGEGKRKENFGKPPWRLPLQPTSPPCGLDRIPMTSKTLVSPEAANCTF